MWTALWTILPTPPAPHFRNLPSGCHQYMPVSLCCFHIIATLVQAAALWGTPGAEVSRRDLQSLETAVLHSLWGTSRPGRAKEIIFVLLVQGNRVSPLMKITYDRVCWLLTVARTPGTLQVVVH